MKHPDLHKTPQQIEDEFKNGGVQPWTNNLKSMNDVQLQRKLGIDNLATRRKKIRNFFDKVSMLVKLIGYHIECLIGGHIWSNSHITPSGKIYNECQCCKSRRNTHRKITDVNNIWK